VQVLNAGEARAVLDAAAGGRIASLQVGGVELLVSERSVDPVRWGAFPMVPFAGRLRHGRFRFDGRDYELPRRLDGHAIHGTLLDVEWSDDGPGRMSVDLDSPWPFAGRVDHSVRLEPDALHATLRVTARDRMPVAVGWHPWWRRSLELGEPAEVRIVADKMFERDPERVPTGRLTEPGPPPWDDCFTDLRSSPTVTWPGLIAVRTETDCAFVVVYTEEDSALCIEPQTGPPDAFNLGSAIVLDPGETTSATMTWRWSPTSELSGPRPARG
jgi:aldose 1-epimerase